MASDGSRSAFQNYIDLEIADRERAGFNVNRTRLAAAERAATCAGACAARKGEPELRAGSVRGRCARSTSVTRAANM
jgi:hypothetical protein